MPISSPLHVNEHMACLMKAWDKLLVGDIITSIWLHYLLYGDVSMDKAHYLLISHQKFQWQIVTQIKFCLNLKCFYFKKTFCFCKKKHITLSPSFFSSPAQTLIFSLSLSLSHSPPGPALPGPNRLPLAPPGLSLSHTHRQVGLACQTPLQPPAAPPPPPQRAPPVARVLASARLLLFTCSLQCS